LRIAFEGRPVEGMAPQLRVLKCRGGLPPTRPIALPVAFAH
jgi:hypothetical protein